MNIILLIIGLSIFIILFSINFYLLYKKIKYEHQYKEEYLKKEKQKLDAALGREQTLYLQKLKDRQSLEENNIKRKKEIDESVQAAQNLASQAIVAINREREAYEKANVDVEEQARAALEARLQRDYTLTQATYKTNLEEIVEELREAALAEYGTLTSSLEEQLGALQREVEDYRQKREAINAEILRQRAIDEKQDFYRICITDADLEDIDILLSLRQKLHKSSFLDKITYDTFVSKYVKEMAKRVLEGKDPSGIYKVTNIKTNEVYVGKSTTVATRWQNHTKSAFGLEGVADSQFQRALKKYGIQNFTWELLEEVPKDKLTEREKYYIDLYDTTKYGYNMRNG